MLRRAAVWILALAGPAACYADVLPPQRDEVVAGSYAFAHELGSGVYESGGHALQVYRIPLSREMDGWRLTLPVTVGLLDFRSSDVLQLNLPSGIGSLSVVPGAEVDYQPADNWTVTPFVKAGYTISSKQAPDALQFGTGVRSRVHYDVADLYTELNLALAVLRSEAPDDHFVRLRNGIERVLPAAQGSQWRYAPWVQVDTYLHAPRSPISGRAAQLVQTTVGVSAFQQPQRRLVGIPLPALGVAYRIAGEQSGWYLAFGRPF